MNILENIDWIVFRNLFLGVLVLICIALLVSVGVAIDEFFAKKAAEMRAARKRR